MDIQQRLILGDGGCRKRDEEEKAKIVYELIGNEKRRRYMSILLVEVVPQGLVFGADRNVTFTKQRMTESGNITIEIHGQNQRSKVLRWPNRKALVGYVGAAEIGKIPTDEWLYDFIGSHVDFISFEVLSESLRSKVEEQRRIDEGDLKPETLYHPSWRL